MFGNDEGEENKIELIRASKENLSNKKLDIELSKSNITFEDNNKEQKSSRVSK